MLKLLIVDDEQEIREGIKYSVDWEKNDIQVVGEAVNGTEALSIINNTFPDIVLLDIRMPEMNGLQLLEALSITHPYIKPIILSGYEDFEYARKGIQFGAFDYLLKPCRPNEILNTVLKAKTSIQTENNRLEVYRKYENDYKEFLPVVKTKYLNILLTDSKQDESFLQKLTFLQFDIAFKNLVVAVIRYDPVQSSSLNMSNEDSEQLNNSVAGLAKSIISDEYRCESIEVKDDIVLLINVNPEKNLSIELIDKVKAEIANSFSITVSIGISNFCPNVSELHIAFQEALHAVEFKFFFGENSTIVFNSIKNQYNNNKSYPIDLERQLLNCIKAMDEKNIPIKLNSFFDALAQVESNKSFIIKSYHALLFSLYQLCIENNNTGEEILSLLSSSDSNYSLSTIDRLKQSMSDLILSTSRRINDNKVSNKLIDSIVKYINENYNKNLSLETVAKNTYITPSYVSLLFKQVLGINFVDYLHKIRLNKACELLRDPKLKSYEIAYMVGYNDDKYFSQIFKKHLGLTPTQYRDNII